MVNEGDVLQMPDPELSDGSVVADFMRWLARERGLTFDSYGDLQRWSADRIEEFWAAIWEYFQVMSDTPYDAVLESRAMPGAKWFPGARLNFAEHVLRHEAAHPDRTVFHYLSESQPLRQLSWADLGTKVRRLATQLRELGISPGDRVASYMPNVPETMIAMLATTAIGAVWTSAAPEFGAATVCDRFVQVKPKLLFAADGYRFAGKHFNRGEEVAAIAGALEDLHHVIWLPVLADVEAPALPVPVLAWDELTSRATVAREDFRYERVPSDHPLWILFSSGTTGLPKAIVHGHAGIVVEFYKAALHQNLDRNSVMFFYSTTGWMMWNTLVWAPMAGGMAVLYDGSPSHPTPEMLWQMAVDTGATIFGTSPSFIEHMRRLGVVPKDRYDLGKIEQVFLAGSPATVDTFLWVYRNVRDDVWVTSQSGGTEFCSGILAASPMLPVRAGEIQGRALGFDVRVANDQGADIIGEVGEMTICKPTPSMPIFLWGDKDFERYKEAYFQPYPDRWRHGDFMKLTPHGGAYVYGRSDATLNRHGVRIGSAEIYATMDGISEVADSMVVCIEEPDGGFYMPLFIQLKGQAELDQATREQIAKRLRQERSPRHVPDEIISVPGIPYTLTGKKMEVPVRKLLMGWPQGRAYSSGVVRDPEIMAWYQTFAASRRAP